MSNKNQVVSISKNRVFPINARTTYSYKNGNPVIQFELSPDEMKLVDTSSMRFNFLLDVLNPVARTGGANPARPNNFRYLGGETQTSIFFNSRVGANGLIDNLRLSNFNNEVIEEIRGYGRLLASTIPALTSFEAYKNYGTITNLATAKNAAQGLYCNGKMACSLKLRAGLLNSGQALNLNSIDGLKINIQLAADSFFIQSTEAADSGAYYQLSNCSLTYNSLNMAAPLKPTNEMLQYPAYSSFINVIQSSDDTQTLMLNKNSVRAAFSNMIKTADINNITKDSLSTNRLRDDADADQKIKSVVHMRNNVKFPRYYDIDEKQVVDNGAYEAELGRAFLDCFKPYNSITSSLQSPETQGFKSVDFVIYDTPDVAYVGGIGANYDQLNVSAGAEFNKSSYSVRIQSELNGDAPNTIYTYSLCNEGLRAKNQSVEPVM